MKDKNKNTYNVAVIGIGRIGMLLENDPLRLKPATHFGLWSSYPNTQIIAVCDNNPKNLEIAKKNLPEVKTYLSAEEMFNNENIDIVSIATWKDTHYEMMNISIENDIPAIVCEKPIAEQYEQAEEIVNKIKEKEIHLFINHRRRFDPLLYTLKNDLKNGIIGEILQVSAYYVFGLITTGTHLIDALRFFLTEIAGEVKWVAAFPNQFKTFHPVDDPCIDGFLGFENGLKVSIQSLNMKDYDIFDFYLYGKKGKIVFKNIGRDIEIYNVIDSPEHKGFTELGDNPVEKRGGVPRNQFGYLAKNVIDCIEGRATSLSTGEDSLKALQILLAMQESAQNNGKVTEV